MKNAMREHDVEKRSTIRMLMAAIKQVEVDERIVPDDDRIIKIIHKMIKQRQESERIYRKAGRDEAAEKEAAEITILKAYVPQQMSEDEIQVAVRAAIEKTGASGMADMGKIMGVLKNELAGRADMGLVNRIVKSQWAD